MQSFWHRGSSGVTPKSSVTNNNDVDVNNAPSRLSIVSSILTESKLENRMLKSQSHTTSSSISSLGASDVSVPFSDWKMGRDNMNAEVLIANNDERAHHILSNSIEKNTKNAESVEAPTDRDKAETSKTPSSLSGHYHSGIYDDLEPGRHPVVVARFPDFQQQKKQQRKKIDCEERRKRRLTATLGNNSKKSNTSSTTLLAKPFISSVHRHSRPSSITSESNINSSSMSEDKNSSSGSSDDGGYEGSASSNDVGGGSASGSCSSPSYASSDEHRPVERHHDPDHNGKDEDNHHGRNCGVIDVGDEKKPMYLHHNFKSFSKRCAKRMKRSSSFSSEIADFSSGAGSGSGSPAIVSDGVGALESEMNSSISGIVHDGTAVPQEPSFSTTTSSKVNAAVVGTVCAVQKVNHHNNNQPYVRRKHLGGQSWFNSGSSSRLGQESLGTKTTGLKSTGEFNCYCKKGKDIQRQQKVEDLATSPHWSFDGMKDLRQHLHEEPQPSTSTSTKTLKCRKLENDRFSTSKKLAQQQHQIELKATFQSALKQLDQNTGTGNHDNGNTKTSCYSLNHIDYNTVSAILAGENAPVTPNPTMNSMNLSGDQLTLDRKDNNSMSRQELVACTKVKHFTSSRVPIYDINADVMACIMSYLYPVDVNSLLSMPLSKMWRSRFTNPQDTWKILCLSHPFYAKFEAGGDNDSNDWLDSFQRCPLLCSNLEGKRLLGKYRLLYSSFIKCLRYLEMIKDDAKNGRTPSGINKAGIGAGDEKNTASSHPFNSNSRLRNFFSEVKEVRRRRDSLDSDESSDGGVKRSTSNKTENNENTSPYYSVELVTNEKRKNVNSNVRYAHSSLTQKLLGPVHEAGIAGDINLPWSCAIYSVVNWMVVFTDVAGIQNMCLKVLPYLLEDEKQRTSAQHAGLTDIVLRAMVLFPSIAELHTAAFHTLVLLARPLGGKEGMLFQGAMVNTSRIFNVGSNTGKNGIAVMLDSMKRFSRDEDLQAMGCWSMVNIALIPSQKVVLVKLGGISVAANAMMEHPHNHEVQFRALFALINLVIPSESLPENSADAAAIREQIGGVNEISEQEMLDEAVGQITNLVVMSMKNFFRNEAILNRACLVLHNLSLNENYHSVLLWTANCYQMLEWCIGNYRHDVVLQQSAGGTLQRLQMTLANDGELRQRFAECIRAQQQHMSAN